jgi:PAS domain S-box-containing protein
VSASVERDESRSDGLEFLAGGGEMGARIRAFDWTTTPLGPPERWPQSLKTIVRVMLDSRYAMWMLWGPELTFFCNDAYLPTVGVTRDWVLGARSDKVWEEVWEYVEPRLERVLQRGEATWDEGLLLFLERSGFPEETYHTFSYSPVYDDHSRIAGMLCVVTEITDQVIHERQLHVLRDLASAALGAQNAEESCRRSCEALTRYPADVPFAGLYLIEESGKRLVMQAHVGARTQQQLPATLAADGSDCCWPVARVLNGDTVELNDLNALGIDLAADPWPDRVRQALLLPIKGSTPDHAAGLLIVGTSPRRKLDDSYRDFCNLVAGQISSAIADAEAIESERKRLQALAEIDRAKTAFFSNVSHEFRTPLTLMLGPINDVITRSDTPEAIRSQLELAYRNALRLLKLVNSLLDFSRIEAGRVQARFEPVDLADLTRDLASTFRSAIERAGLKFVVECASLSEPVYVDRDMWEKVVLNLLSNAFKFTMHGSITVRLSRSQTAAVLEVIDTGVGVPEEEVPRLFERFHRVQSTRGRTHEGTGIGLALVHELVKLHGGTIEAVSELGVGTTFRIEIPFGRRHLPADRIGEGASSQAGTRTAQAFVEEAIRWLPDASTGITGLVRELSEAPRLDRRFESTFGARIILADDNADMRSYLRELLAPFYIVESAHDGEQALALALEAPPDLILTDVMMPKLDGFELLRAVRAQESLRDVPVILLSARAGEDSRIEGLDAGADDYLVKPFSARELLARVGALLELTRMRAENERRLSLALSSIQDRFYMLDSEWRFTLVNPRLTEMAGRSEKEFIGRTIFEVFPEISGTHFEAELLASRNAQSPRRFETFFEPWGRWFANIVYPAGDGVAVLATDITDQVLARRALMDQQRRLEEADRQKDQFLAMLAHELRNPLAPIRNAGELLSRMLSADAKARPVVDMIKRQSAQLTRLVDDLLDVSRITRGRVHLQFERVDLTKVVQQAVETVEPLMREKRHRFSIAADYGPMQVRGDFARLVQCVVNILANAAKYTDAGGMITLSLEARDGFAVIEVRDSGVGISAELLPKVFDLFVQGDRSLDRAEGGLGIGLSVVKGLISMHDGEVGAASEGQGRGSVFSVRLPLIPEGSDQRAEAAAIRVRSLTILVVDDNVDAANSLATLLTMEGHTTEVAYGAKQALEMLGALKPDAVLLDIGLPEMDGYELARRIRARPELCGVRLIALSGYGQEEDKQRSLSAGFAAHLVKPVAMDLLSRELAQLKP